jgi:hypothetical protein
MLLGTEMIKNLKHNNINLPYVTQNLRLNFEGGWGSGFGARG